MFLIGKMMVYLLLAGGIGLGAGWLLRNLQAQRSEEQAARMAHDAKSKLPQLESLLRGRDEQIGKLKQDVADAKRELKEGLDAARKHDQARVGLEREIATLKQKLAAQADLADLSQETGVDNDADNQLIAELSAEIARLKQALADASQGAPTGAGSSSSDEVLLRAECDSLSLRLQTLEREHRVAVEELTAEQGRVGELERERELQNKSLQVLHQQLRNERTRKAS